MLHFYGYVPNAERAAAGLDLIAGIDGDGKSFDTPTQVVAGLITFLLISFHRITCLAVTGSTALAFLSRRQMVWGPLLPRISNRVTHGVAGGRLVGVSCLDPASASLTRDFIPFRRPSSVVKAM